MNRRRLLLGLAAVPAYYALRWVLRNEFVLTNESGQFVHDLTVEVCDQSFLFDLLGPGESVSARFGTRGIEDMFGVHGRLADGRPVDDGAGYVVSGEWCSTFRLFIRPDGMIGERLE